MFGQSIHAARYSRFLVLFVLVGVCPFLVHALEPLHRFEPPPAASRAWSPEHSQVTDRISVSTGQLDSLEDGRLLVQVSYRDRADGQLKLATGEMADRIEVATVFPIAPRRTDYDRFGTHCFAARSLPEGGNDWTRMLPRGADPDIGSNGKCLRLAEGDRSTWFQSERFLFRVGRDGQILLQKPLVDLGLGLPVAANIDPIRGDLLVVHQADNAAAFSMLRITDHGARLPIELPDGLTSYRYHVLLRRPEGGWILLAAKNDGRQRLVVWTDDFSEHREVVVGASLVEDPSREHIADIRWLNSEQAMVLITKDAGNVVSRSFRIMSLHVDGSVAPIHVGPAGHIAERLFVLSNDGFRTRTAVLSRRRDDRSHTLGLHLFRDDQLLNRREIPVTKPYHFSMIGKSGEFVLALHDPNGIDLSLLNATGGVLDQKRIEHHGEPVSTFLRFAPDGHFRSAFDRRVPHTVLTKHATNGAVLWRINLSHSASVSASDDERICIYAGRLEVVCHAQDDGRLLGSYPVHCNAPFTDLRLQQGRLYLRDCPVFPARDTRTLEARAVFWAAERHRMPDGDVLWSNGTAVRRLAADGRLLNTFGDTVFDSPLTSIKIPLRLLPDGSYIFMRSESVGGVAGVAVYRIDRSGNTMWRRFEPKTLFEPPYPPGLFPETEHQVVEIVGNRIHLEIYTETDEQPDDGYSSVRATKLKLDVADGAVTQREFPDPCCFTGWGFRFPMGNKVVEVRRGGAQTRDEQGNLLAEFHFDPDLTLLYSWLLEDLYSPERIRIHNGRIEYKDRVFPLPHELPRIRLDQESLDGAWETVPSLAPLDGQGLMLDYLPRDRLLFGAWFLYAPDSEWRESDLRWLTLSGTVPEAASRVTLGIYLTQAGHFNAGPPVQATQIGTAEIRLDACNSGAMTYRFDDGEYQGRSGTMVLKQIASPSSGCATNNAVPVTAPPIQGFGFSSRQSGGYYEPGKDGQGVMVQVRPDLGAEGTLFATWFTFDPEGTANDPHAQHWFTLEGELGAAVNGAVPVTIVRANGGLGLEIAPYLDGSTEAINRKRVGHGTIRLDGCQAATLDYVFDDAELAGAFRAKRGTTTLVGFGNCATP